MSRLRTYLCSVVVGLFLALAIGLLLGCEGDRGPVGPAGPATPAGTPLGHIEDTRVVFEKSELSVINPAGVLLNLVATEGHVGIRFYKDFDFGNEQQTNPWHMGFIEGVEGYQGLAILRDWLFTAALWDGDGKLIVGRLDSHPPANGPARARFEVRGTVDEVQALVEAPDGQAADIFRVSSRSPAQGQGTTRFAVDGHGNAVIGSPTRPTGLILYDTEDGVPYALTIASGQVIVTRVN